MLLAALSTGQKVGLGLVALAFILFALASAFLIPSFRPDFPGRRGLPAFLTLCVALFAGMMFSVFFLGREADEGQAAGSSESQSTQSAPTTSETQTTSVPTTQSTSTRATTTQKTTTAAASATKTVGVTESEFKIALASQGLKAGKYEFDLKNDGKIEHDLVIQGPGVNAAKTPVIDGGKSTKLTVQLKSGTYELYCDVPGHKQAGMDVKVKVT